MAPRRTAGRGGVGTTHVNTPPSGSCLPPRVCSAQRLSSSKARVPATRRRPARAPARQYNTYYCTDRALVSRICRSVGLANPVTFVALVECLGLASGRRNDRCASGGDVIPPPAPGGALEISWSTLEPIGANRIAGLIAGGRTLFSTSAPRTGTGLLILAANLQTEMRMLVTALTRSAPILRRRRGGGCDIPAACSLLPADRADVYVDTVCQSSWDAAASARRRKELTLRA